MRPNIEKSVLNFAILFFTSILCLSPAFGDSDGTDARPDSSAYSQSADDGDVLGACSLGDGICEEMLRRDCVAIGQVWNEGKCPTPGAPPMLDSN